jgi:hypothetical protein
VEGYAGRANRIISVAIENKVLECDAHLVIYSVYFRYESDVQLVTYDVCMGSKLLFTTNRRLSYNATEGHASLNPSQEHRDWPANVRNGVLWQTPVLFLRP